MPSAPLAVAAAAVLGTLAAAPLSPDGRALDALGIVALCVRCCLAHERPVRASVLLALGLFAANAWLHEQRVPALHEMRTARYSAVALASVHDAGTSSSFAAALDGGLVALVHVRGTPPPPGSRIVVRGRFEPFDVARNAGEPSEIALERERGFDAQIAGGEVLSTAPPSPWETRAWLPRAHVWALAQLRGTLGEPAASIVAGELWGERSDLPPDLRTEFQETGTVHVLVTAGLHLGVVAALVVALLAALALPRAWSCGIAIVAVWAFVLWSGAQLPATRAAIMVTTALCARALGRASFSWNSLALAAIVIAALRPQSVATPSFALSFSCVGAIFACAPLLERCIEGAALPRSLREAMVLSVATQLGTWPLTAAVFLQFSPYAVVANLAVVPCVGASIGLGMLQLLFAPAPTLAQMIANLQGWVIAWVLAVVRTLSALPGAALPMTPAPAHCIAAYDAALLFLAWCARRRLWTPGVAAMLVAIAFVLWPAHGLDTRLRITVIDVGQADAILIETPAHHALLVDAGGRLERGPQSDQSVAERVGEQIVVPFLLRRGIHTLDAIVLTHPHGDHAGGVAPVLRKLRVAELADGGQRYTGHAYLDAVATARADSVPVVATRAGDVWRTDDGVVLHFIGPSLPFIVNSGNDINDNSIAFTLRYRSFCMLFTGDAGTAAEQRFLRAGVNLRCAILKVGHHGSAYGTTPAFLDAVRPQYAIISVGRHNMFGHPAPSTLATLERFGATVYRTDENGAVTVLTDGRRYSVEPFIP
ncbi:MAG TPA: DNA internalization-related competence protein ComEC/Rec2 [Candidatus Tyrphobacter sp.]